MSDKNLELKNTRITEGEEILQQDASETKTQQNTRVVAVDYVQRWSLKRRIFFLILLDFGYIAIGFYQEVLGVTLIDVKEKLGVNYEEISRSLSATSVGYLFGAFVAAFIFESLAHKTEMLISLALFIGAIATAFIPFSPHLNVLIGLNFFSGYSVGTYNPPTNTICVRMFGSNAPAPLHSLHFSFGIGAILSQLIARPFLSVRSPEPENMTYEINFTSLNPADINSSLSQFRPTNSISRIEIPFLLYAGYTAVMSLLVFLFGLLSRQTSADKASCQPAAAKPVNTKSFVSTWASCSAHLKQPFDRCLHKTFSWRIAIFFIFFYCFVIGGERIFGKFIFPFAVESTWGIRMAKQNAAVLTSVFWIGFTSGRGSGILVGKLFRPVRVLILLLIGNFGNIAFLIIFASHNQMGLWIFVFLFGYFNGPLFASGVSYANERYHLNIAIMAFTDIGNGLGGFVMQWLTGLFFQVYGPQTFPYVLISYVVGLVFVCSLLGISYKIWPIVRTDNVPVQSGSLMSLKDKLTDFHEHSLLEGIEPIA